MHHGQTRGNEKHIKYVKKIHVNLTKSEGKFEKVGGNKNFPEIGRKCTETAKVGRDSEILVND